MNFSTRIALACSATPAPISFSSPAASWTETSTPARCSALAAVSPPIPPPMIATRVIRPSSMSNGDPSIVSDNGIMSRGLSYSGTFPQNVRMLRSRPSCPSRNPRSPQRPGPGDGARRRCPAAVRARWCGRGGGAGPAAVRARRCGRGGGAGPAARRRCGRRTAGRGKGSREPRDGRDARPSPARDYRVNSAPHVRKACYTHAEFTSGAKLPCQFLAALGAYTPSGGKVRRLREGS